MKEYRNRDHLELLPGELFVGNANTHGFEHTGWKDKRAGDKAFYDEIGESQNGVVVGIPYKDPDYFPVFVLAEEVKQKSPDLYQRLRSSEQAAADKAIEDAKKKNQNKKAA